MNPLKVAIITFCLAVISVIVIAALVVSPYDTPTSYVVGYSVILSALLITSILALEAAIPEREDWPIDRLFSRGTIGVIRAKIEDVWR